MCKMCGQPVLATGLPLVPFTLVPDLVHRTATRQAIGCQHDVCPEKAALGVSVSVFPNRLCSTLTFLVFVLVCRALHGSCVTLSGCFRRASCLSPVFELYILSCEPQPALQLFLAICTQIVVRNAREFSTYHAYVLPPYGTPAPTQVLAKVFDFQSESVLNQRDNAISILASRLSRCECSRRTIFLGAF